MKFKKILLASSAAIFATSTVFAAAPNPATTTFHVKIQINKSCLVTAPTDINFGGVDTSDSDKTLDSALTVKCTTGTPYTIAMVPSNGDTGGAGTMAGTGGNLDTVAYSLFQGPTGTTSWGNVVATNTVAGIGGAKGSLPASYTVTAKVLATEFDSTPDQYDDVVTVNVAY